MLCCRIALCYVCYGLFVWCGVVWCGGGGGGGGVLCYFWMCLWFFLLGDIDYFKDQSELHELYNISVTDKYIVQNSVTSWYEDYVNWANTNKNKSFINTGEKQTLSRTEL